MSWIILRSKQCCNAIIFLPAVIRALIFCCGFLGLRSKCMFVLTCDSCSALHQTIGDKLIYYGKLFLLVFNIEEVFDKFQ